MPIDGWPVFAFVLNLAEILGFTGVGESILSRTPSIGNCVYLSIFSIETSNSLIEMRATLLLTVIILTSVFGGT
jgi:hypothetical protein